MSDRPHLETSRIAVVGGGLAGLAATVALAQAGAQVELFEARRRLGGRATSYRDPASSELVDHCQHVSMGCCTNLADFCRRVGIADLFRHDRVLHFFGPDGARFDFEASRWLPAPGHLGPALARLGYLSRTEHLQIARAMWRLMRNPVDDSASGPTVGAWLQTQGQSPRVMEQFWSVVLVSALSETLDRASLFYTRKVFVDGFLNNRNGYVLEVPHAALDELYGSRLESWLVQHRVALHAGTPIASISANEQHATLVTKAGESREFDYAILATPWHVVGQVCSPALRARLPELELLNHLEAVPITGVHLWFDTELTTLPHAVLVSGLSQWLFRRPSADAAERGEYYYQVVISASRDLANRSRDEIIEEIRSDLGRVFPAARTARLLRAKIVTEQSAVFSPRPGVDRWRPQQQTAVPTFALAGDWTATGWPATMEGAVRSGYLAAEAALSTFDASQRLLKSELPQAALSKWLVRR